MNKEEFIAAMKDTNIDILKLKDVCGNTPLMIASNYGHTEVIKLLKQYGTKE